MDINAIIGRAQRLLFSPATEWDAIASEPTDMQAIYMNYVGPLVIAAGIATGLGLLIFGLNAGFVTIRLPLGSALTMIVMQIVMQLAAVYVVAYVINMLAPQFGAAQDMNQAFKTAAYFPTAAWIASLAMIIPQLSVVALVGGLYSLYLLYVGLPKMMKPAPDKVVIYTISVVVVSVIAMIIANAIVSAIAIPRPTI